MGDEMGGGRRRPQRHRFPPSSSRRTVSLPLRLSSTSSAHSRVETQKGKMKLALQPRKIIFPSILRMFSPPVRRFPLKEEEEETKWVAKRKKRAFP